MPQRTLLQPISIDRCVKCRKNQPSRLLPIVIGVAGIGVLLFILYSLIGNNKGNEDVHKSEIAQMAEESNYFDETTEDTFLELYYYHSVITDDEMYYIICWY